MTNKNHLTTEAYKEMGNEVSNVIEDLRIIKSTLEFIKSPQEVTDITVEYYKVHQYTHGLMPKVEGLIRSLENVDEVLCNID